ncbi:MAG: hypothetical protein AB7V04_00560 [Desulfomonilaceae bacterium]
MSHVHATEILLCMIKRLERLQPLIRSGKLTLLYDSMVGTKSLENSKKDILLSTINSLPTDIKTRWFIAIKSMAQISNSSDMNVELQDFHKDDSKFTATVPSDFVSQNNMWLSFSGTEFFKAKCIKASIDENQLILLRNCSSMETMVQDWPKYEPSPKHRLEEYSRGGEHVSPMDLLQNDAQAALLVAIDFNGSKYSQVRGKIYRFVQMSLTALKEPGMIGLMEPLKVAHFPCWTG